MKTIMAHQFRQVWSRCQCLSNRVDVGATLTQPEFWRVKIRSPSTYCQLKWCRNTTRTIHSEALQRKNEINIQMLSENLHKQIFGEDIPEICRPNVMKKIQYHLEAHGLWDRESTIIDDVNLEIPKLVGQNINEHFQNLAQSQVEDYKKLASLIIETEMPPMPKQWEYVSGWTKYDADGRTMRVDYPEEDVMVFDTEVLVTEGHYPTMAVAVSNKHWYSWVSNLVIKDRYRWSKQPEITDLIPMETRLGNSVPPDGQWGKKLVIGHNVAFDRSFIKEQYYIQKSQLRFMDTMSLHVAVCGQTSFQRVLYQASKKATNRKDVKQYEDRTRHVMTESLWKHHSTMNNLNDVYQLHCDGDPLNKDIRDTFVKGNMADVRNDFQNLMTYCANDVKATLEVFKSVYPEFLERLPSPVTLSGMMEMGTAYLPVNQNWNKYIEQSDIMYDSLQKQLKKSLMKLANDACRLLENEQYKNDPWLWDLDWSVKEYKLNKAAVKDKKKYDLETKQGRLAKVYATTSRIPKVNQHMTGYPKWYRDLCPKANDENFVPGPSLISTQTRVTPKLMRLTWEGCPLHYSEKYGWGYLIPSKEKAEQDMNNIDNLVVEGENQEKMYPVQQVFDFCEEDCPPDLNKVYSELEIDEVLNRTLSTVNEDMHWREKNKHWVQSGGKKRGRIPDLPVKEAKLDEYIPGCYFIPLPHKDGVGNRVGNPLAKDFLGKVEGGILQAQSGGSADNVLKLGKMCSYWKNNMKRIGNQMTVCLREEDIPESVKGNESYHADENYGAIIPKIVPAGTITRRAVEQTWLTASNAYEDRIGSELRAMVQCPPGYKFVGADVDSQELWIAAVIGDSEAKIHGSTAFGWMTLQGKKSDKTDLHSKTADTVGISRDHAKIFNYGRIYGAGKRFAQKLLMQFNHRLTEREAALKAEKMYSATKGNKRKVTKVEDGQEILEYKWTGGSESTMFNKLEEIARQESPKTPVLSCSISKALQPEFVGDDFMTSRINWVVQSSAVDYLHLMLVCMQWLIEKYNIDARFTVSIHDEVRFMVKEEDKYRLALALQITNLLTRSVFAYNLGMKDLPQSVAFFSAVDIDTCIRKEVTMVCKTPSNPHGMERGYGLPFGEALDVYQILEKTNGGSLEPVDAGEVIYSKTVV